MDGRMNGGWREGWKNGGIEEWKEGGEARKEGERECERGSGVNTAGARRVPRSRQLPAPDHKNLL